MALTPEEIDCVNYDAREGDLETLQAIFEEIGHAEILNIKDAVTLSTPVHMAAGNGHAEVLEFLLSLVLPEEARQLASSVNDTGNTPLHWASYNGHTKVVEILCEKYDADPFLKNALGHDSIYESESSSQSEAANWFLNKYAVEDDVKVEEKDGNTKITYTPGSESKEADERANSAKQAMIDVDDSLPRRTESMSLT